MQLRTLLEIRHGLTAIIGGGGKTTLLYALAKECSMDARVIVCTTTHILKPSHLPCVLSGGEAEIQARKQLRLRGHKKRDRKVRRACDFL